MGIFKLFDGIRDWAQEHHDVLLDVVRIYLGVGLFAKGLQFVGDREFFVRELGPPDATPLVLLHGWSFDGEMTFFGVIPDLAEIPLGGS